jgi:hypothetical protein
MLPRSRAFTFLWLTPLLLARAAAAAWPTDPSVNLPVCLAPADQGPPRAVSDGAGGALIAWKDARAGGQIYAQHVSASGVALWAEGGVPLGPPGPVQDPMLAPDGAGGAVIAWVEDDGTSRSLKAQRLSGAGVEQWASGGVTLRQRVDQPNDPNFSIWLWDQFSAAPDGAGGMYVAFAERHDEDNAIDPSLYTSQLRLLECDAAGSVVDERVLAQDQYVCNHCGDGFFHLDQLTELTIAAGAPSGVVAAFRARPIINHFTMFMSPEIRVQEPVAGLAATLVTGTADVRHPRVASDGAGGAIASWEDTRSASPRLYAGRMNSAGAVAWGAGGIAVSGGAGDQFSQEMCAADNGAVTLAWLDRRNSSTPDLYAQRLDAGGTPQWLGDVALCTQPTIETEQSLTRLDDDATAFAWRDTRSGTGDIYAHVVSPSGVIYGAADGDAVCVAPGDQSDPAVIAAGTQAIVTWMDDRGSSADLYAQLIGRAGPVSGVPPNAAPAAVQVSLAAPNPTAGPATIRLSLPNAAHVVSRVYDLHGRRVRSLGDGVLPAKVWTLTWDGLDDRGHLAPAGLYLLVLDTAGQRFTRRVLVVR